MRTRTQASKPKPIVKWAGGKRQLLPCLRQFYPETFGQYVEPFVGGGAVFVDLHNRGVLNDRQTVLLDKNYDLIGCYQSVRDHTKEVIEHLSNLAAAYAENPEEHYYWVRDQLFNPARHRLRQGGVDAREYPAALAAMFIFLNRTGFNGLYRLNRRGAFNVPMGRYDNPQICDAGNLKAVASALATQVTVEARDFEHTVNVARPDDFVYLDPPYEPLPSKDGFTNYTSGGFSGADQERLQRVAIELAARGCWVLLSNSTAPLISQLYDGNEQAQSVGLEAYRVSAKRAINSKASGRGPVLEYVITNIPRRRAADKVAKPQQAALPWAVAASAPTREQA